MRKRMLLSQSKPVEPAPKQEQIDPRKVVAGILAGRAVEVLETARRYYPAEISELESRLAQAILSGGLTGPISGEELYSFLRRLGLSFSLDIKIRVREGGKLKSLEEKLRGKD
jgi:DNA-binding TFAR19-related protein (PDSD5 family)